MMKIMTPAHNLYIHVPFCISKCNYCAFFSHPCRTPDWDAYASAICDEIKSWRERLGQIVIPTVFFGGGTPSLMPTQTFGQIMTCIAQNFDIAPGAEITLESNPGTLDATRLREFMAHGINRLSVGVQSLNDDTLRFLGRRHTAADALTLIDTAHKMGLRTSGDFIYGIPDQTADDVARMCRQINAVGLRHCSMYELTIEPDTPFEKMNLAMPSNDTMADMYTAIGETLALPRYEVSNYAALPDQCRHNANIWAGDAYIGLGRGAAGRVIIDGIWHDQMGADLRCAPMTSHDRAVEKIITGMRTMRGVQLTDDVRTALDWDAVAACADAVTLTPDGFMAPTAKGILILDNLLVKLIR
ncbi:MAG: radical SAM family heme chaperone HemW [Alphaproteobacteria bacterium]|nr:radical SAM family heme chaperone HemW [Alphaproteobacteria bacterium]